MGLLVWVPVSMVVEGYIFLCQDGDRQADYEKIKATYLYEISHLTVATSPLMTVLCV